MAITQTRTRLERDLPPYVSPKKDWDAPVELAERIDGRTVGFEVFEGKAPSVRGFRRQRQRDQLAMGKKSRRKAFRQKVSERHNEQNLHGMAQVHLLDRGTEAMQDNVSKAVWVFAEKHSDIKDIPTDDALDDVEGAMHSLLVQYGDIES